MKSSGFPVDRGAALGAGDDDFSLTPRDTADGAALGTGEVFVVLIPAAGPLAFQGVHDFREEPGIFAAALGKIPGKHTEQGPHHQEKACRGQDRPGRLVFAADDQLRRIQQQDGYQRGPAQRIDAVASVHKAGKCVTHFLEETHSIASISMGVFICIILQENTRQVKGNSTKFTNLLRIILLSVLYFHELKW